ncbi:MAG: hypothetical protein AB9869_22800 [Verrucomicrobiia bacterium]
MAGVQVRGGHDALHAQHCERFRVRDCDFRTGDDGFAGCDNLDFDIRNCQVRCLGRPTASKTEGGKRTANARIKVGTPSTARPP